MNTEDIAVMLAEYGNRIKVSENRIKDLEEQNKAITELAISSKEMAINIKHMVDEQQKQSQRLDQLEAVPNRNFQTVKVAIITAVITFIVSAGGTALINAVIK